MQWTCSGIKEMKGQQCKLTLQENNHEKAFAINISFLHQAL